MRDLVVHDKRLSGNTPTGDFETMEVDKLTPLHQMVVWAVNTANCFGGISRLKILAHGFETTEGVLGYGLCLCDEGLSNATVHMMAPLKGLVNVIQLYSCGVANSSSDNMGTESKGDGFTFCRQLAVTTGAWVKASTATQLYWKRLNPWHWMEIDFGDWEGDVYWFSPDGVSVLNASPKADSD
jgi:hypothetical protein